MQQLPSRQNPFARALTLVVAAIVVGVSLLFGFIAFLILAGMALILVAIVAVRVWWLRRKLKAGMREQSSSERDFIEGEYEVEERTDKTKTHER
jgi:membrane protein implicated in regulation of membrane protease activity